MFIISVNFIELEYWREDFVILNFSAVKTIVVFVLALLKFRIFVIKSKSSTKTGELSESYRATMVRSFTLQL